MMRDMSAATPSDRLLNRAAAEAVKLLPELIHFDTSIFEPSDAARDDLAHQEFIAAYLRDLGVEVDMFEPRAEDLESHPLMRFGHVFKGRPIIWARLAGTGTGPSLLFNGHFDTVPADPVNLWSHRPWSGDVVDGRIYGRGACDMKGGIAAALAVAYAVVAESVRLPGDLFFNVAPFEEVSGMGTVATMLRGYRADAAICCEPTELNTLITDRGVLIGELSVKGRSAHAEIGQPHHSAGGGVSAIDKLVELLYQLRRLNEDWRLRPDKQHDLLSTPYVLCTLIQGGSFASNWPPEARATLNVCYLPTEVDRDGYGKHVKMEVEKFIEDVAAADSWLADHQPVMDWEADFPAVELEPEHPLVAMISAIAQAQGVFGNHLVGYDTWADNAMLVKEGGMPSLCFGPGSILDAHAVDESVSVNELETCARIYTQLAFEWGGRSSA
jgi:acetylornithine deacetylase